MNLIEVTKKTMNALKGLVEDSYGPTETLICKVKKGDASAFKDLISKYSGALLHYGRFQFRSVDEDVLRGALTQTYYKLKNELESFIYINDMSFWVWLCKVYYRATISYSRKLNAEKRGGNSKHIDIDTLIKFGNEPAYHENQELKTEQADLIDKVFQKLPSDYKAVLVYYSKGFTDEEIGRLLNRSTDATKSLRRRAIAKARTVIKGYYSNSRS